MIEAVDIDALVSAAAGGAASVAVCRALISKSFKDMEKLESRLYEFGQKCENKVDEHGKRLSEHEKIITRLETRLEVYDKDRNY